MPQDEGLEALPFRFQEGVHAGVEVPGRIPQNDKSETGQLVGWLVGGLVGWLAGWFVRSLVCSFISLFIVFCLFFRSLVCLIAPLFVIVCVLSFDCVLYCSFVYDCVFVHLFDCLFVCLSTKQHDRQIQMNSNASYNMRIISDVFHSDYPTVVFTVNHHLWGGGPILLSTTGWGHPMQVKPRS